MLKKTPLYFEEVIGKYKTNKLWIVILVIIMSLCACGISNEVKPDETSYIGQVYTIESFPYMYKESTKLLNIYQELKNENSDLILVSGETKLFSNEYYYKKTLSISGSNPYNYYYGELKDDKPHGKGILLTKDKDFYCPIYIGEFSEGYFSGHGIMYEFTASSSENNYFYQVEYEGNFNKGEKEGTGCRYYTNMEIIDQMFEQTMAQAIDQALGMTGSETTEQIFSSIINKIDAAESIYSTEISKNNFYSSYPLVYVGKWLEGEWKDGEASGNVIAYNVGNSLSAEGEFKEGFPHGKVKIYYPFTNILEYEGEMKKGKYHGKGILYNEDGTIRHKGTFKNGNIA